MRPALDGVNSPYPFLADATFLTKRMKADSFHHVFETELNIFTQLIFKRVELGQGERD